MNKCHQLNFDILRWDTHTHIPKWKFNFKILILIELYHSVKVSMNKKNGYGMILLVFHQYHLTSTDMRTVMHLKVPNSIFINLILKLDKKNSV